MSECRTINGQRACKSDFKAKYGSKWRKYWKAWKKEAKGKPDKAEAIRQGKLPEWRKKHGLVSKIGKVLTWPVLMPLKVGMVHMLKAKGFTDIPKSLPKIALMFYNVIIKKGSSTNTYELNTIDPVTLTAIITAILTFFKQVKEKRDRGETIPAWQDDAIDKVEREVERIREQETTFAIGDFVQENIIIILIVLFFLFK